MSSVLQRVGIPAGSFKLSPAWTLAIVGFLALYLPVYYSAAAGIWQSEEQGHGAIVLAVMCWLFWTLRHEIDQAPTKPLPVIGWLLLCVGLLV